MLLVLMCIAIASDRVKGLSRQEVCASKTLFVVVSSLCQVCMLLRLCLAELSSGCGFGID